MKSDEYKNINNKVEAYLVQNMEEIDARTDGAVVLIKLMLFVILRTKTKQAMRFGQAVERCITCVQNVIGMF